MEWEVKVSEVLLTAFGHNETFSLIFSLDSTAVSQMQRTSQRIMFYVIK